MTDLNGTGKLAALVLTMAASFGTIACDPRSATPDTPPGAGNENGERARPDTAAIADSLRALVEQAYDLTRPDVVERLMKLYPDSGPVVSAAAGRVTSSRDSLRTQIDWFWNYVGRNMQQPRWEWATSHVRVLGPDAAVLTATYRVPHRTPEGRPHVVSGAWTMVFERQGGRWVIVHEHLSDLPSTN